MKRLMGLLGVCCAATLLAASPAMAARKAQPAPTPSASPAAAPQPTPEPLDKAIPRLQAKIKADPNDRDSMQELAGDYLQANRPDLAYQLTQQLIKGGTKTALVLYMDGFALAQMGRPAEALGDLEQASNLDPTNPSVLTLLTNLYLQGGRLEDADRVAKRATTFNKNDPRVFMNYGIVLATEKKYDESRVQFETAAKLDPKNVAPLLYEAKTYTEQGAAPLALQVLDRALAIDPRNPDVLLTKAQTLGAEHNVKDAVAIYEQLAYGDYLAFIKQNQRAEQEWTTALGPNRDNKLALVRLGEFYAQNNDLTKAAAQFQRLIELDPNDAAAYMSLGQIQLAQKQSDKAHDSFRKAYDLSHAPPALAGVGQADYDLKNYKEAADIFDALDRGAPQYMQANPFLYVLAGKCYAGNKDTAKAKAAYNKFLALVKPDSQAAIEVKRLLAELDHPSGPSANSSKPAPKPANGSH